MGRKQAGLPTMSYCLPFPSSTPTRILTYLVRTNAHTYKYALTYKHAHKHTHKHTHTHTLVTTNLLQIGPVWPLLTAKSESHLPGYPGRTGGFWIVSPFRKAGSHSYATMFCTVEHDIVVTLLSVHALLVCINVFYRA